MKLIYITNARIPTEKAHGLQIMKMCEAFAAFKIKNQKLKIKDTIQNSKLSDDSGVQLIIPRRINSIKQDPFEYYDVKKVFKVKRISCLDLFWLKIIPLKISFYIQWFSFAVFAVIYTFFRYKKSDNIFYSRDWLILFFLRIFGIEPVAEIHDYKAEKPKKWWIGYVMKKVKKIITNSEGTKFFLQEHYAIPDDKILVAPNGVDVNFFNIKETKEEACQKLNLPQSKFIISYIGRLETLGMEKGVDILIEAFSRLLKMRGDILLLLVGGPDNLIKKYSRKAKELSIGDDNIIFTGQIPYKTIPNYLRAIDIVVVPFPYNKQFAMTASPIKIFEFMAAGKVILASELPSLRSVLNEKNASFFEPGNVIQLSEKLSFLMDNQEISSVLALGASQDAKKHTWRRRAANILNLITT